MQSREISECGCIKAKKTLSAPFKKDPKIPKRGLVNQGVMTKISTFRPATKTLFFPCPPPPSPQRGSLRRKSRQNPLPPRHAHRCNEMYNKMHIFSSFFLKISKTSVFNAVTPCRCCENRGPIVHTDFVGHLSNSKKEKKKKKKKKPPIGEKEMVAVWLRCSHLERGGLMMITLRHRHTQLATNVCVRFNDRFFGGEEGCVLPLDYPI